MRPAVRLRDFRLHPDRMLAAAVIAVAPPSGTAEDAQSAGRLVLRPACWRIAWLRPSVDATCGSSRPTSTADACDSPGRRKGHGHGQPGDELHTDERNPRSVLVSASQCSLLPRCRAWIWGYRPSAAARGPALRSWRRFLRASQALKPPTAARWRPPRAPPSLGSSTGSEARSRCRARPALRAAPADRRRYGRGNDGEAPQPTACPEAPRRAALPQPPGGAVLLTAQARRSRQMHSAGQRRAQARSSSSR